MSRIILKYKNLPIAIKASFWFVICAFLQKGISFITTPIFTRLLSTEEYGQYNVFTSWMSILSVIITLNLFSGFFTRGLVIHANEKSKFASAIQGLTFCLVLFWTLVYSFFQSFWNSLFNLTTVQMYLMIISIWCTAVFSFWSVEQRVSYKYRTLVAITILVSLLKPILSILFVINANDKVTARILALVIIEFCVYTVFFIIQQIKGKKFFVWKYWKQALIFNIPLIPHYLSSSILNSADRIMIVNMVGESESGIYSLAYSVSMIMTILNTALLQTIEPWLYTKIKNNEVKEIKKVAYPTFALVAVANIFLIALAPEIIRIFAPEEYFAAIYVIPPIAMSVFFRFSYTFFAVFEFYYKKTKLVAIATTIGAILNIALNFIFIKLFGYMAAGYTTLICFIIYAVFHYIFMNQICKKELNGNQPYSLKIYLIIAFLFVGLGFVFLATYNFPVIRYCLIVILLLVVALNVKKILKWIKFFLNNKREVKQNVEENIK